MTNGWPAADWGAIARVIHVLAVVVWIGSVWLVTMVVLPNMRQRPPAEWLRDFDAIEHRFAPQARVAVLLVLLSGLYMLYQYDLWDRLVQPEFWWMHLMVGVWILFAALLFIIEPLIVGRLVRRGAVSAPRPTFTAFLWLHRLMLALSLAAIAAAVGGSHGLF